MRYNRSLGFVSRLLLRPVTPDEAYSPKDVLEYLESLENTTFYFNRNRRIGVSYSYRDTGTFKSKNPNDR